MITAKVMYLCEGEDASLFMQPSKPWVKKAIWLPFSKRMCTDHPECKTVRVPFVDASCEENFVDLALVVVAPYGDMDAVLEMMDAMLGVSLKTSNPTLYAERKNKFILFTTQTKEFKDITDDIRHAYQSMVTPNTCGTCNKTEGKHKHCSRCNVAVYCSTSCQRKQWALHCRVCSLSPKMGDTIKKV